MPVHPSVDNGSISSGRIKSRRNILQSYFACLSREQTCPISVVIGFVIRTCSGATEKMGLGDGTWNPRSSGPLRYRQVALPMSPKSILWILLFRAPSFEGFGSHISFISLINFSSIISFINCISSPPYKPPQTRIIPTVPPLPTHAISDHLLPRSLPPAQALCCALSVADHSSRGDVMVIIVEERAIQAATSILIRARSLDSIRRWCPARQLAGVICTCWAYSSPGCCARPRVAEPWSPVCACVQPVHTTGDICAD